MSNDYTEPFMAGDVIQLQCSDPYDISEFPLSFGDIVESPISIPQNNFICTAINLGEKKWFAWYDQWFNLIPLEFGSLGLGVFSIQDFFELSPDPLPFGETESKPINWEAVFFFMDQDIIPESISKITWLASFDFNLWEYFEEENEAYWEVYITINGKKVTNDSFLICGDSAQLYYEL